MIDIVIATIDVCKQCYLSPDRWVIRVLHVHEVGGDEVKIASVELDFLLKQRP
jgi:hypothetical protein